MKNRQNIWPKKQNTNEKSNVTVTFYQKLDEKKLVQDWAVKSPYDHSADWKSANIQLCTCNCIQYCFLMFNNKNITLLQTQN